MYIASLGNLPVHVDYAYFSLKCPKYNLLSLMFIMFINVVYNAVFYCPPIAGAADEDCGVHDAAEPPVPHGRGGGAGAETLGLEAV